MKVKRVYGNKYYTIFQCALMLDKYYEKVRNLSNENQDSVTLDNLDLKEWQEYFYPELIEKRIVSNGEYFENGNGTAYGVQKDGSIVKSAYCRLTYSCYKILVETVVVKDNLKAVYDFCRLLDDDAVDYFRGKGYSGEIKCMRNDIAHLWKSVYYTQLSKSGLVEDSSFFSHGNSNQDYGIGADALYSSSELMHFLYRAYRYIYSFSANYSEMVFCGVNLEEYMVNRFYCTSEEGIVDSICFLDPLCSVITFKSDDDINTEYVFWQSTNDGFIGVGERTQSKFQITLKDNKLSEIISLDNDKMISQSLFVKGRLLEYWVGIYLHGNDLLRVKDYDTIIWNGKNIRFEYDEINNGFAQLTDDDMECLVGNFHIVEGKKRLTLNLEDTNGNRQYLAEFLMSDIVDTIIPQTPILQYKYDEELYLCVFCNQFYHHIDCYTIKDGDPESMQFISSIPSQGVFNIFLSESTEICFVTGGYIVNAYKVTENDNYVLLGIGEDFDSGCSVHLNGFSYFSCKTRFDYIPEDLKDQPLPPYTVPHTATQSMAAQVIPEENDENVRRFYLIADEDSDFIMIKFEEYIIRDGLKTDVYVKMPNAERALIQNIDGFTLYENGGGGILYLNNPQVGIWEITIPKDDKIEIAISGQVLPLLDEKVESQRELVMNVLSIIYDYPELKYAEMLSPLCSKVNNNSSILTRAGGVPIVFIKAGGGIIGAIVAHPFIFAFIAIGVVGAGVYYLNSRSKVVMVGADSKAPEKKTNTASTNKKNKINIKFKNKSASDEAIALFVHITKSRTKDGEINDYDETAFMVNCAQSFYKELDNCQIPYLIIENEYVSNKNIKYLLEEYKKLQYISFKTHGYTEGRSMFGYSYYESLMSNTDGWNLKGKIFNFNCCNCGKELAKRVVIQGAASAYAYANPYSLILDDNKKHRENMIEMINKIDRSLLLKSDKNKGTLSTFETSKAMIRLLQVLSKDSKNDVYKKNLSRFCGPDSKVQKIRANTFADVGLELEKDYTGVCSDDYGKVDKRLSFTTKEL